MNELLEILKTNARESVESLAKQLNLSEDEVQAHITRLESEGVIKGYQAIINEDVLEHDTVKAVIEVKVTPEREGGFNAIAHRISKFPEVTSVYLMSGAYDLILFVQGDNLHRVASFVSEKLATIPGVNGTATHFMLKTYKHRGVLMEKEDEYERLKVSP